jgi:cyclic beta-1,2-glucan synthetase
VTARDPGREAVLATNAYNEDFPDGRRSSQRRRARARRPETGSRCSDGSAAPRRPAALARVNLAGRFGPTLDPCGALEVEVEIPPGEERTVTFLLGQGRDRAHAEALLARYTNPAAVTAARAATLHSGRRTLGAIRVSTPDDSFDVLMNGWLQYQSIAARLWARCGYDQPGGAFGFRDQLQDVMSLGLTRPDLWRAQLVHAASRQSSRVTSSTGGTRRSDAAPRTRCSGRFPLLPYVAARYVAVTGDKDVWDEAIPFSSCVRSRGRARTPTSCRAWRPSRLTLRTLPPRNRPRHHRGDARDAAHRRRRLERRHEPRRIHGGGERVARFFLGTVLRDFAELCDARGDRGRAARYRAR